MAVGESAEILDARTEVKPGPERSVSPVELLWDLVFVFAITQVGTLLSNQLTWDGFGRSMLVLALVWWAWSAFVWVANAEDAESPVFLLTLLAALVLIFISGLAIPHAFGERAPPCTSAPAISSAIPMATVDAKPAIAGQDALPRRDSSA